MLNLIVWNRTVYMYKMDLALISCNIWCAIKSNHTKSKVGKKYRELPNCITCIQNIAKLIPDSSLIRIFNVSLEKHEALICFVLGALFLLTINKRFSCLIGYPFPWIIQCQRYTCGRTVVVLFYPALKEGGSSKVNMIAWLEFELAYNDIAI